MTDDELIELIETRAPDELTPSEMDALRQALPGSATLRAALAGRLQMEQVLGDTLGRFELPIDRVIERAGLQPKSNSLARLLGWGTAVALLLAAGAGLIYQNSRRPDPPPVQEVDDREVVEQPQRPLPDPVEAAQTATAHEPSAPTPTPAADAVATTPPTTKNQPDAQRDNPPQPMPDAEASAPLKASWAELVASDAAPRAALEAAFDESLLEPPMRVETFRRWAEPLPGQPYGLKEQTSATVFDGLAQLRSPWGDNLALRVWLHDHHGFKLHFWNGDQGVTLWHYAYPPSWVAYQTTRKGNAPRPATFALAATDDHRWSRSGGGRFELRHADGYLRMSRGDLLLLAVPMPTPPQEVILDGRATFRALAIDRSLALPLQTDFQRPALVSIDRPAAADWQTSLPPGATLEQQPDGGIELRADKSMELALASLPLGDAGLCEAIFELDDPQPGTGIFLGDEAGQPLHQVGFFREARSGATSFGFIAPRDRRLDSNHDMAPRPAPLSLRRQWLRLVLGCGTLKCWTSADGRHWSRALAPIQSPQGLAPYRHIGLYCNQTETPRRIGLRSFQLRKLPSFERLAPPEAYRRALALTGDDDLELAGWMQQVIANQPADIEPLPWRRACAVKSLASGVRAGLGMKLILGLLDEALAEPTPLAERLQLLEDVALIAPTWEGSEFRELATALARRYETLGQHLWNEGESRPYTVLAAALRQTPIATEAALPLTPESLVRCELLHLVQRDRWEEAVELSARIGFWSRPADPNRRLNRDGVLAWADWAEGSAFRSLSTRRTGTASVLRSEWRHPLIEVLSKEGYNILAEFNAALEGQSYHDACQIISSADPHGALGLLPDAKDEHLLVSLPAAVNLAMREHVPLRQTMHEQFGPRGRLRVRQAIAEDDRIALEAATTQFSGTEAAAQAHLWLGDRALSSGDFTQALGQYQRALSSAADPAAVQARVRLAGALLGRDEQQPVSQEVTVGEIRYSGAEFEALVADLLRARARAAATTAPVAGNTPPDAVPAAARYQAARWSDLSGDLGSDPQQTQYPERDWAGRQLAATVAGDRMYVTNRFQVVAYDLAGGQKKWSAELSKEHGPTHSWPLVPMTPLVAGEQLFHRRVTTKGPELACFDTAKEKLLWTARPGDHVATDPLLVQDQLMAITVSVPQDGLLQLNLTSFDPASGDVTALRPLVQLRDVWNRQAPCQFTLAGDQLVLCCGGTVLCCDLLGQVHWLRRQVWAPPSIDKEWAEQYVEPPRVADGLVFVSQPGVREVQCLELPSGRLRWQQTMPHLRRLTSVAGGRLVIENDTGLEAYEAATGERLWSYPADDLLHAQASNAERLLVARRQRVSEEHWRCSLVWLDPATGQETARSILAELDDQQPMLGPLVMHGKRLWTFFGRGGREATREIYALKPSGLPETADRRAPVLAHWEVPQSPTLRQAAAAALPGWTLLARESDKQTRLHAEFRAEQSVLATLAAGQRPASFVRWLDLPSATQAKLVLKVGHEPDRKWRLDVRVGDDSVLSQAIEAGSTSEGWKRLEIDLSSYAGRPQWLVVAQHNLESKPTYAYWKQLEIIASPKP